MQVLLTRAAIGDLAAIREHIRSDDPNAAEKVAARIIATCQDLATFSFARRTGRLAGTREVDVYSYVIVYRVTDQVEILRVWHGARQRT